MPSDLGVTSAFWELLLESVMQLEVQPLRPAAALRLLVHLDTEQVHLDPGGAPDTTGRGWDGGDGWGRGQRWEEQGSEGEG